MLSLRIWAFTISLEVIKASKFSVTIHHVEIFPFQTNERLWVMCTLSSDHFICIWSSRPGLSSGLSQIILAYFLQICSSKCEKKSFLCNTQHARRREQNQLSMLTARFVLCGSSPGRIFIACVKWAEFISGTGRAGGLSSIFRAGPAKGWWLVVVFSTAVAICFWSLDLSSGSSGYLTLHHQHLTGIKPVYGHKCHMF